MASDLVVPLAPSMWRIRLLRDFVNTYKPQVDQESLLTPESLRHWLVERRLVEMLRDFGENAPETWEEPFKPGTLHIALTIFAADEAARDKAVGKAMAELERSSGVTLVATHEFGAD